MLIIFNGVAPFVCPFTPFYSKKKWSKNSEMI
jgi:hypothetical protein